MTAAHLAIRHAGPQVSLQDRGRFGLLRYGVPASGPMDRFAFAIANLALGNGAGTTAVEVSRGGLTLTCTRGSISFAVAGGDFQVSIGSVPLSAWCVAALHEGDTLNIRPGRWGSWCYLALAGNIACIPWLGSASTHGPSGLGGGNLVSGGDLRVDQASIRAYRNRSLICPATARPRSVIRVVMGPQDRFFGRDTLHAFLASPFTLSDAYDRMGVRLNGPILHPNAALDMPSEGICRGSVQIAGDGVATVLLADHQTTGGYPKIATILSDVLDCFVQLRSRSTVMFEAVTPQAAIAAARTRHKSRSNYLAQIDENFQETW